MLATGRLHAIPMDVSHWQLRGNKIVTCGFADVGWGCDNFNGFVIDGTACFPFSSQIAVSFRPALQTVQLANTKLLQPILDALYHSCWACHWLQSAQLQLTAAPNLDCLLLPAGITTLLISLPGTYSLTAVQKFVQQQLSRNMQWCDIAYCLIAIAAIN